MTADEGAAAASSESLAVAGAGPLLAATLWGGMYVVSKWGFASVPPATLTFLRIAVGGGALLLVVRAVGPSRPVADADRRRFVGLGALVGLTMLTQFLGTDLTNASQGSLLTVLTPVFTVLLGVAVLGERLTRRSVAGLTLAVVGTLVVVAGQYDLSAMAAGNALGVGLLLVASLGWGGYTVAGAPLVRKYSALEAATYSTVAAVPMVGIVVPIELVAFDAAPTADATLPLVAAVLYLGLASTAAAWFAWYKGLETVGAGTVAAFFFAQPVVGSLLGATLLGETLGAGFLAGGAVMAVGVYLASTADVR